MSDSDSDVEPLSMAKPPPKRRRLIDPSSVPAVPIYSNKVNRCLQLKPVPFMLAKKDLNAALTLRAPPSVKAPRIIDLSGDEEEEEKQRELIGSPSPPPPSERPGVKMSRTANQKISELNRNLNAVDSLLTPSPESKGRRLRGKHNPPIHPLDEDDDLIIVSPTAGSTRLLRDGEEAAGAARQIPLKFRCRTDLYKIPLLSTASLHEAVNILAVKLDVAPSRILLLKTDVELPAHSTISELGLGIADIIDCVVTAADHEQTVEKRQDVITIRLQGQEKGSTQEYSLHKDSSLGPVLSQYLSGLTAEARDRTHFRYDGCKLRASQTPSQLDMEDGDVIEVWT